MLFVPLRWPLALAIGVAAVGVALVGLVAHLVLPMVVAVGLAAVAGLVLRPPRNRTSIDGGIVGLRGRSW